MVAVVIRYRWLLAVVLLLAALLLWGQFSNTRVLIDVSRYDRLIHYIEDVKQARRDMDYGILQMKAGLSHNYDQLNQEHGRFKQLVSQAEQEFSSFSPRYDETVDSLLENAKQLNISFERFKADNALMVNSESYIPFLSETARELVAKSDFSSCSDEFNQRLVVMLNHTLTGDLVQISQLLLPEMKVNEFRCTEALTDLNAILADLKEHLRIYRKASAAVTEEIAQLLFWERMDPLDDLLPDILQMRSLENKRQAKRLRILYISLGVITLLFLLSFWLFYRYYQSHLHHQQQSLTDPLTGVGNRLYLNEHLAELLDLEFVDGITLFYIDLDGFKAVNDNFSHADGDRVLIDVTGRIVQGIRREDRLFRIGGDEFVLISCGKVSRSGLIRIASALLASCHRQVKHDGQRLEVTASIGIAQVGPHSSTVESILAEADTAMYRAKELGKNRYMFAEDL